jgi:uncharacterized protein (TIGR02246 family)
VGLVSELRSYFSVADVLFRADIEVTDREDFMVRSRSVLVLATFLLASLAFPVLSARAQADGSEADSAAIRQVVAQFLDAFNHHDAQGWAMPFTEDGDFTNVSGLSRHGRKEIEERFKGLFAGPLKDAHRTVNIRHIRFVKPDVAAVDAEWELTNSKAADGSANPPRKGIFTWVMVKQGKWQFADFHESEFVTMK